MADYVPPDSGVVALDDLYPEFAQQDPFAPQSPAGHAQPRQRAESLTLAPTVQTKLLTQLREHYDEAMDGADGREYRRAQQCRRYLADVTLRDGLQPWTDAPQVFLSVTRTTIERFVVEMMHELCPDYERIMLQGIGDEDVGTATDKEKFFRWVLEHINHFRQSLREVGQDLYTHGLGIFKAYPRRQDYAGWLTPEDEQALGPLLALLKVVIALDAVDESDLLIPPDATGLQPDTARYLGQRLWPHTIDDFDDLRARGFVLKPTEDAYYEVDGDQEIDETTRIGLTRDGVEPTQWHRGRVEMVESYERFDWNGDGVREYLVVHWFPEGHYGDLDGGGQLARVLLLKDALPQRAFPKPTWPFFPVRAWSQPRQLRGMSVVDRIEVYQDVLNRLVEQCLHQGEIDMLPYYFYNAALTGELPDLTQIKPGQGVPMDTGGNVVFKPNSSHNQHYAELLNLFRGFVEEDTSITAANQGRNASQPNAPRTVGGLALLLQEGNKSKADMVTDLADQVTLPLRMAFGLWQSHVPSTFSLPLPDTTGLEARLLQGNAVRPAMTMQPMTAEALDGPFDLTLSVNPDALIEQQKLLTLAEKIDPMLADFPLGRRALWKYITEKMGFQQFDRFWPEEVARLQTMLLVLQKDLALGQIEVGLAQLAQAGITPPPESAALLQEGQAAPGVQPLGAPQGPQLGALLQLLQQAIAPAANPAQPAGIAQGLARTTGQANNVGAQLTQGI